MPDILDHIRTHGPVTVAEYMRLCVAQYYAARDPFGAEGDFTTAPEISQIFGELTGAWLADAWRRDGAKQAVLCELGPGRGTLMRDLLRATRGIAGFHAHTELVLVENSPHLRKLQQQNLQKLHPRAVWKESLDTLPPLPLFLIANEFFDALPVNQYVKTEAGWEERMVEVGADGLCWAPQGDTIRESSPASMAIMARIAAHIRIHGGAALIIDYGYGKGEQGDTLQAVRAHQFSDPLEAPGESDLTAHVDFTALKQSATSSGACAWGAVTQGQFLRRIGAELRAAALATHAKGDAREAILSGLERIVAPHEMGELFKVLAITSSLEPPPGF